MGLTIEIPKVMVAGSIVSDYDASRIVPIVLRTDARVMARRSEVVTSKLDPIEDATVLCRPVDITSSLVPLPTSRCGEMVLMRRGDENLACVHVARYLNITSAEQVHVGYTSDSSFVGKIVQVQSWEKKKEDLGLFRVFDASALAYLYDPQRYHSMVRDMLQKLAARPDLFLMLDSTFRELSLREHTRVKVQRFRYVDPIEKHISTSQDPILQGQMPQQMPHLPEFEGIFR
jgi:hypothetical protein